MPKVRRWMGHATVDQFVDTRDRLKAVESMQNPPAGFSMPYASAYAASATPCANAAYTPIPLTIDIDAYGFGGIVGGCLVIPVAGMWQISWAIGFDSSSTNGGFSLLTQNTTGVGHGSSCSFNGDPGRQSNGARILSCAAGDEIGISAWQNQGSALDIVAGTNHTFLDMFLFGPT
jgi:hypothetical protein